MMLTSPRLRANLIMLLAAIIWGFAFVAQRQGMDYVGPFTFTAIRFFMGGLVLIPLMLFLDRRRREVGLPVTGFRSRTLLVGGVLVGVALFVGATFQQLGIIFTTAGKAGFITSLYVVIVPILGLLLGHRISAAVWVGALAAAVGLYFLTIEGDFRMAWGDLLVLAGAFVWAVHLLLLHRFSPATEPIKLAFLQFMVCAAISLVVALLLETVSLADLRAAVVPIFYAGVMSVGVGYTLQVVGQSMARPTDAAIIFSLEAVFAIIGGWLLLGEALSLRALIGCAFMLAGIIVSQLGNREESDELRVSSYE